MNATHTSGPGRRGVVTGMALTSLVLPMAAVVLGDQPVTSTSAGLNSYRLLVSALVIGLVAAAGTIFFRRALAPAWLRRLSVGLAGLGMALTIYLLLTLIGTCGATVLWGSCAP